MELSSSLDPITGKLISVLENEASLLAKLGAEIDEIKLELKAIRAFLEDADTRLGAVPFSETDKQWVASVRDIAYEVEDVVDEFMYHFHKQQQWRGKPSRFFLKLIHFPKDLLVKHQVAVKLKGIDKRIKSIADRNQRYPVSLSESRKSDKQIGGEYHRNNWVKNLSESTLFFKDDDLVGIDKAQSVLLGWLMDQELQRTVISVLGMGGLGKTTLVANTFNRQVVKQHFDCCAWITVSQQYVVTELFKSIIKGLYNKAKEKFDSVINLDSMSYLQLVEELVNFLQPRRYLVVIDDVWSTNLWQDISIALPANMNGSRILLTTRKEDVASFEFGVVKHIFLLKHLPFEESMALFCKKAFVGKGGQCPPYLESSAAKLVAKCQGLPLAIVALGGLMASKNSVTEWNGVLNNLNRELSENDAYFKRLKYISLLSYNDLSYTLKQCFLYCCIFPEDHAIKRKRLIRLWMAEGFVEPLNETTPEVVAERYLTELICRGLLQVERRNASGRPKILKMHDILREFAVSISKSIKFAAKSDGKEEVEDDGIRRWSIEAKEKEMKDTGKTAALSRVRSFFVFSVDETSKSFFNRLPSGFKLMRVLDLEDTPINELPDELENLFNLRYLNLTRTQVKELPKSIGKLYNLQSLVMKETQIKELPAGIVKLKNLRHLIAYRFNANRWAFDFCLGTLVPSDICLLNNLQVLATVAARGDFIKQLSKMVQLRRLNVANVKETDENNLCFAIAKMIHLRYLQVKSCNEDEQLKMDALESAPPFLETLALVGKLEKAPHWFNSLESLRFLFLQGSRLRDGFLLHIQALPNLRYFFLLNACEGDRLDFLEGFQKLKRLRIEGSPRMKEIVINKGVMPGLQQLNIDQCQEFTTLPHGWESLPDLKQVYLSNVSPELIQKICRSKGIDRQTITGMVLSRQEGTKAIFNITRWH
ncbi:RESISTANCE TO PSEUDOMONAS SYRINGAE 3, RESISTANCE TO P. SYRINGAE PV MACULICOLA 1 [Hibiscus trionum]|uniref:RESISTANCE TO PSEUDOMONAS SYRINGAE 3, RESISTANCE TO P. SYRINGAE PV MACULICOLA 1 n=1 Tax=Hibiscus trionum TaxID=183268 RepID=A0A9W7IYN5_HIBTR|nr:RESISTANCE TO PSEUDOMONAS SYRINGAE 3, RESISTANCE TO P. SYRINGAE PV MACULICOLA 1 [Hibiscus trionum]